MAASESVDSAAKARELLKAWKVVGDSAVSRDITPMNNDEAIALAHVYATLAVADAIREHTNFLKGQSS